MNRQAVDGVYAIESDQVDRIRGEKQGTTAILRQNRLGVSCQLNDPIESSIPDG
jgi:hypothetical protein